VPRLSAESSGGSSEHSRILKALAITTCDKREAFAQARIGDGRIRRLSSAGKPIKFSDKTPPRFYTSITLRPQKVRLQSAP
jgi:hypothetical protein